MRVHPVYTNFTSGEITKRLMMRVDLQKYNHGCDRLENAIPLPHGPAVRRPGSRYVASVKNHVKKVVLVPFIYNDEQAYIIEFGDQYARFYKNGGQIQDGGSPQERATPYVEADLFELKFTQDGDVLYIAHRDYTPRKLERRTDATPPPSEDWNLVEIDFLPPPTYEADTNLSLALTLSAATVGTSRTATLGSAGWFPADVDREIIETNAGGIATGGRAVIRSIGAGPYPIAVVTVDILVAFSGTSIASGSWRLTGSPSAVIKTDRKGPRHSLVSLKMQPETAPGAPTAELAGAGAGNVNAGAHKYRVTFVTNTGETEGGTPSSTVTTTAGDGKVLLKSIPTGTQRCTARKIYRTAAAGEEYKLLTTLSDNTTTTYSDNVADASLGATVPTSNTATVEGWRTADVGKYVKLLDGIVEVTERVSASEVRGELLGPLNSTDAANPGAWTLEVPTWDATRGYPGAVGFYSQRLGWAGTKAIPQGFWLAETELNESHVPGTADTDAIEFEMNSSEINIIRWMVPLKVLIFGTSSAEWRASGSTEKPINPTNVHVDIESAYGSSVSVNPLKVGSAALFVTRSGRRLRELSYTLESDSYDSSDLLKYAEHLTRRYSLTQLAFQREPDPVVWAVRSDGTLLSMTYEKSEAVFAWSRHLTGTVTTDKWKDRIPSDGFVESVAVIPHPDGDRDQVWIAVRRTINGATKRYIEHLDDKKGSYSLYERLLVDSGLTYDGQENTITLTLSAASVGTGRTCTASAAKFASGDVGKEIWHKDGRGSGRAKITAFTSSTVVTVEVLKAFDSVNVAAGWYLAVSSVSGLDHLAGKTVAILGDGAVYPDQTVPTSTPFSVTLDPHAAQIEVGLPYTTTIKPVRPEVAISGTSQGRKKHWAEIRVRLYETVGCKVNGEQQAFRSSSDNMDEAVPLFSDDVVKNNIGYDTDGFVEVVQEQPLPLTVVGIFGTLQIGDN